MPTPRTVAASVVKATEKVVEAAAQKALASLAGREDAPLVPGAPAPEPPTFAEPTEPQGPLHAEGRPGRSRPPDRDGCRDRGRSRRRGPAG